MNAKTLFNSRNILIFCAILTALLLPLLLQTNQYVMVLMTTVLISAVLASAWNIIGGMAGQLDLAAAAYLGLGAFTTGTLLIRWNITPWLGMFVGGVVAVGLAMLIGFPLFGFKVKELWYGLSSSAMVVVLQAVFMMWRSVGGATERYLPAGLSTWYSMRFDSYTPYYYIMLVILVIVLFVNWRIRYSKLGYSLLALGEDEDAVEVLGVNSQASKLKALAIYAFICGAVGGVYACLYGYIHPSFFDTSMSMEIAILGIVGGMGFIYGPALAAVIMVSFREYLRSSLGGQMAGLYLAVYAIILILVALYQPRGIAPLLERGIKKVQSYFAELRHGRPADVKSQ
ncbi:MAG TPA: branched-chain amino acid ABC transporter permease [Anaerolineaceae bacterium]|nr:branched-chain amino acid ABC transporter permease [Anaerolineaceae bacterium]